MKGNIFGLLFLSGCLPSILMPAKMSDLPGRQSGAKGSCTSDVSAEVVPFFSHLLCRRQDCHPSPEAEAPWLPWRNVCGTDLFNFSIHALVHASGAALRPLSSCADRLQSCCCPPRFVAPSLTPSSQACGCSPCRGSAFPTLSPGRRRRDRKFQSRGVRCLGSGMFEMPPLRCLTCDVRWAAGVGVWGGGRGGLPPRGYLVHDSAVVCRGECRECRRLFAAGDTLPHSPRSLGLQVQKEECR